MHWRSRVSTLVQLGTRNFGHRFCHFKKLRCKSLFIWQRDIQKSNFEIYFLFTSIACQSKSSQTVQLRLIK
jgi:hypothetical protein